MNDLFNKSHLEKKAKKIEHKNKPTTENQNNKLLELKDKKIIKLINPLLKNNKVLEAVKICSEYYNGQYNNMTFKDWFNLINSIYKSI
jgi:hypothetical protein